MSYTDEVRMPRTMTDSEIAKLLAVTGEHRDGYRDHILYALALATGLREHELVALNVGDVYSTAGTVKRRVALQVYKRSNEDAAAQEVFLGDQIRAKLARFWRNKKADGESLEADAPLFVSREGNRLSTRTARWGFSQWQERAGFDRRFTFHQLRHTAATNVYRASGKDIMVVRRFARHASVRSTQIYTHATDQDLLGAVNAVRC